MPRLGQTRLNPPDPAPPGEISPRRAPGRAFFLSPGCTLSNKTLPVVAVPGVSSPGTGGLVSVYLKESSMANSLRQLWADDHGAVISTELVLVIGILIFGIIPGLVA